MGLKLGKMSGASARPLRLIGANGPFRVLWLARTVSYLGDSLGLVALMLQVANTTREAMAVALLLLAGDFAPALFSPLTGAIGDRFPLQRVMVSSELAQGALMAVIAVRMPSTPILLVLVGLRAIAGQIFQPASRAIVPALVRDRDLEGANTAIGLGTNGAEALGPVLAALLLPVLRIRGVLAADAITFAVSACLLASLPAVRRRTAVTAGAGLLGETVEGLRYIATTPLLRIIGLGFFVVVAFNGVDDVALVFLAKDTLNGGDSVAALLLAAAGTGLLLGYALLAASRPRSSMAALLLIGFAISSTGNLLTGTAWAVGMAFAFQSLRGIGLAAIDVGVNTLIQQSVPENLLGRVFGSLYGAIGVAAAVSYAAGGLLLDATTARATFVIAGIGGIIATVTTAVGLKRACRSPIA